MLGYVKDNMMNFITEKYKLSIQMIMILIETILILIIVIAENHDNHTKSDDNYS